MNAAIAELNLAENRLAQVIVCCRSNVPLDEFAALLPDGVTLADVEPQLAALEARALVWRYDGRLFWSRIFERSVPTRMGPPLADLVTWETVDYLTHAVGLLRDFGSGLGLEMAPPPNKSRPSKPERLQELAAMLATPGLVPALLKTAPPDAVLLSEELSSGVPYVRNARGLSFRLQQSSWQPDPGAYWLFERGLLVPVADGMAAQPREVGLARCGGRPIDDLMLERPPLVVGSVAAAEVEQVAVGAATATLDQLTILIERLTTEPLKALKSGGIGIAAVRKLAKSLGFSVEYLSLLAEFAFLSGLLEPFHVQVGRGRNATFEEFVGPAPQAAAWCRQPLTQRWCHLGRAWLRSQRWPSSSGRKDFDGRNIAVASYQYDSDVAFGIRRALLDCYAELDEMPTGLPTGLPTGPPTGTAGASLLPCTNAGSVFRVGFWDAPTMWLSAGVAEPHDIVDWIVTEAELLGFVALGRLSTFASALLAGDAAQASTRFAANLADESSSFTLQADLTAVAVGRLEATVHDELRLVADIESRGAATTFRFSEASVRRALDEGRSVEGIRSFLEAHASKGVPGPLEFLLTDVARRYGHLTVHAATTVLLSDDPAVLADACSHKKTRKLGIRLLSPTIAISSASPALVRDGLREAGFLPTMAQDGTTNVGRAVRTVDTPPDQRAAAVELIEPFSVELDRPRSGRTPLEPDEALRLAELLLAEDFDDGANGRPRVRFDDRHDAEDLRDDDDLDSLRTYLEEARDQGHAAAVDIGSRQPLILELVSVSSSQLVGINIRTGTEESVYLEDIISVADLGVQPQFRGLRP